MTTLPRAPVSVTEEVVEQYWLVWLVVSETMVVQFSGRVVVPAALIWRLGSKGGLSVRGPIALREGGL